MIVIHPSWTEGPLVQQAIARAGADLDPATILEELSKLLNELEEAAPGIPFADILAVPRGGGTLAARGAVAGMLLAKGMHWKEVDQTVGPSARVEYAIQLRQAGVTLDEIERRTNVSRNRLYGANRNLVEGTVATLRSLVEGGASIRTAARKAGVSEATAHRYLRGVVPGTKPSSGNPDRKIEIARSARATSLNRAAKEHGVSKQYVVGCVKWAKAQGYID
jgi:hypothetical protein